MLSGNYPVHIKKEYIIPMSKLSKQKLKNSLKSPDFCLKSTLFILLICVLFSSGCRTSKNNEPPITTATAVSEESTTPSPTAQPEITAAPSETPAATQAAETYRIGYYTQKAGLVLEDTVYETLSAAKAALRKPVNGSATSAALLGYCVYDGSGKVVSSVSSEIAGRILAEAKEIYYYLRNYNFVWGDTEYNPAINHSERRVSCDRFVGWVLYNAGYTDQPSDYGLQLYGYTEEGYSYHGHSILDWFDEQGFEKIDDVSKLKPGDIVLFQLHNSEGIPDHMCIYAGTYNGNGYRYDGGYTGFWTSPSATTPLCASIETNAFLYAYRAVSTPS